MGASGLGSLLVKEGFLTEQDRLTITKTCGQGSWAFAKSILAIGLLDEDELAAFFAERTRYQIAPKDFLNHLDQAAIQSVDRRLVSKLEVIPLKKDHGKITVGVVDPLDRSTLKQLEFFTGFEVDPVVIPLSQLYEGLTRIDPEFRYQPTALTHFLQNHAQSAWVRQKLENDDGTSPVPTAAASSRSLRSSPNDIEEIYDDLPEIEEVEEVEDSVEIEEDEFAVQESDPDSEYELEDEKEAAEELDDPFAGAASAAVTDLDDDLGAEISSRSKKIDSDDLLELDDGSEDEDDDLPVNSANSSTADFDFDSELGGLETASIDDEADVEESKADEKTDEDDLTAQPLDEDALSEADELSFDANEDGNLTADLVLEEEDTNIDALFTKDGVPKEPKDSGSFEGLATLDDDDEFDREPTVTKAKTPLPNREDRPLKAQDDFDFEMDEIKADTPPMSTFGFEETKPRAMPSARQDILDNMDDLEPSLDVSKLPGEDLDRDLLADLHSEIEADDHSPNVDPSPSKINFGFDDEPSVVRAASKQNQAKSSFQDDEETHIDLRASPSAKTDDHDDDILLHPETAALKTQSDSGLNPTSAINELMVKLSLCWNPEGTLQVLRENLNKIGDAGALLNTKSQHQILWANGNAIGLELGPAALLPMVKGASLNKWQSLDLKSSESWTQKALKLKVYRTGDWLWAHSVKVNDDTAIFRDTVESVVSQVAHKLGR